MEAIKIFERYTSIWPTTCNNCKTASTNCFTFWRTNVRHKSRHHESVEQKKGVNINERTVRWCLNEAGAKYNRPLSKPLLNDNHREKRLKWVEDHRTTNWDQLIFTDETTIRLNSAKGFVWNLPGKKRIVRTIKHPIKVNAWGWFSTQEFGRVLCFNENLNDDLMCDIYKYGLLSTAQKQFGHYLTLWKLQEDNDPRHTSELSTNWRMNNNVYKIDWPSMSPDLAPIENVWQLLKMKLRKKKTIKLSISGFRNKTGVEVLTNTISYQTCT